MSPRGWRGSRLLRLAGGGPALLLLLIPALTRTADATPAPTAGAGSAAQLRLVEQTAWVAPNGDFTVRVAVHGAVPGSSLEASLHDQVTSRTEFTNGLDGQSSSTILDRRCAVILTSGLTQLPNCTIPLDRAATDADGAITIGIGVRSGAEPTDRVRLTQAGAYPYDVRLVDPSGDTTAELVTHLLRLPSADDASPPLAVSLVVPFASSTPGLRPDGTTNLGPNLSNLDALTRTFARHAGVHLTVVPSPETLTALERSGASGKAVLTRLEQNLSGRQVLARTYADIDLTAWFTSGLRSSAMQQFETGTKRVRALLGLAPDPSTALLQDTTTPATLDELHTLGAKRVVVPEAALQPLDTSKFPIALDQPFELAGTNGTSIPATMADAGLASHAIASSDPVVDAHQLLADLTVLYAQRPGLDRGVTVVLPSGTRLDPTFLDTLLGAMGQPQQVVNPTTVDELFASATIARASGSSQTAGPPLVRVLQPATPRHLGAYPQHLAQAERGLDTYATMFPHGGPQTATLNDLVLTSGERSFDAPSQDAYLAAPGRAVAGVARAIVTPDHSVVTLTARTGRLQVQVRNDLGVPVDARVELSSDKLEFPKGNAQVRSLPPGESRVEITVRTRVSGAFPVDVSIRSPDDVELLASTRFTLRSTAVPGIGLVLSGLAALFLAVWWARHWRTTRRARRLVPADHQAAQDQARQDRDDVVDRLTEEV